MSGIFSCVTKNSLAGWKAPDHGCQNLKVSSAAEFRPTPAESGLGAAKSSVENEGRFGRVFGFAGIYNGSVTRRQHEWYRISMNKCIYIVEWYASVLKFNFAAIQSCCMPFGRRWLDKMSMCSGCQGHTSWKQEVFGIRWLQLVGMLHCVQAAVAGLVSRHPCRVYMSGYNTRHDESVWMNIGQNAGKCWLSFDHPKKNMYWFTEFTNHMIWFVMC